MASRWTFLQQAVATVESKLDNILSEEDDLTKRAPTPASTELSRSNSNASAPNDRLQERLARAMAKKNVSRTESPVPSREATSSPMSRGDDPVTLEKPLVGSVRPSLDVARPEGTEETSTEALEETIPSEEGVAIKPDIEDPGVSALHTAATKLIEQQELDSTKPATGDLGEHQSSQDKALQNTSGRAVEDTAKSQEELNAYLERIDALHAKLQYLSKDVAASAKQAAASAGPGDLEKRIAEKDEKIALLIEEGTKLSKKEMNALTTIKKLRVQTTANNKEKEAMKVRAEKAEQALKVAEEKARRAEAASRRAEENLATNDFEAMRRERDALHSTLTEIRSQLSKAHSRAEAAENKAHSNHLDKERRRVAELQDDLTSAKVEREIAEEKLQREVKDLQASLEREKEQSRAMESEMLSEQAALESKLEYFRVRVEEASSADHGHVQAKLLRQIETLQSQYATATQNWQGIESSLLGRITNLGKERDEIVARETDLRKKLRDATLKLKNKERELDSMESKYAEMDKSLADAQEETRRLGRKVSQLEADLAIVSKELEDQKATAERDLQRRLDEEKGKWTATLQIQRTESPGTSIRKGSNMGFDVGHLMSPVHYERSNSRRSSMRPPTFDSGTPPRQPSTASFQALANGSIAETPSVVTSMDADEYFANVPATPVSASHHSHRGVNDLISTSTVGAGPSVQLVERMSANVRRLESEKAASKDELLRISSQRDEARQEVVSLMREVEEKRKIEARLSTLEDEHRGLSQRHQTTLELLGEKSEQVEELKADILDVKQMYRQLADTLK